MTENIGVNDAVMNALKPCPFCGNPDVKLRHYIVKPNDWWYVYCTNCCIAVDPLLWNESPSKEEAIQKWNRRYNE